MMVQRLMRDDRNLVKDVLKHFFTREAVEEQINKFLSDSNNYMLVHKIDNKLTGFAYGYELQRFDGKKNMVYIHQIEVLPPYRNQGIGKMLMEAFVKEARKNNCGRLFLITNKSNSAAVHLYRSSNGKVPSDDDIVFVIED